MSHSKITNSFKSGMTLIELVVVLALLAGLAAMALTSVSDLGIRSRYDETTTRMRLIRDAVVGDGIEAGRFVRDMGRLPVVHTASDGIRLEELWRDAGNLDYGPVTNSLDWPVAVSSGVYDYVKIELLCGWNGPYLMMSDPAEAESYDGFGNPWYVRGSSVGDIITNMWSLGADNATGGATWYDQDRLLDLEAQLPTTKLTVVVKGRDNTNVQDAVWLPVENAEGSTNAHPYQLDTLVVALFTPEVTQNQRLILRQVNDWTNVTASVSFDVMPTCGKVYAYGTNIVSGLQVSGSEPELVTLNPGHNLITLYLREP